MAENKAREIILARINPPLPRPFLSFFPIISLIPVIKVPTIKNITISATSRATKVPDNGMRVWGAIKEFAAASLG